MICLLPNDYYGGKVRNSVNFYLNSTEVIYTQTYTYTYTHTHSCTHNYSLKCKVRTFNNSSLSAQPF